MNASLDIQQQTTCEICQVTASNARHTASEKMYDMGGEFTYEECSACGCLKLLNPPEAMADYYPDDYYSFTPLQQTSNNWLLEQLKQRRSKYLLGQKSLLGGLLSKATSEPYYLQRVKRAKVDINTRFLDVGCGGGTMLCNMRNDGFQHLTGADPFIADNIDYPFGVTIYKRTLAEMDPEFDVILSHHSFEHMPDPEDTFAHFKRLLATGGKLVLSIPLAGSYSWKKYGVNWINLDAPRHLYLHTPGSIETLATRHGFKLLETVFDSNPQQFWASEQYQQGIGLRAENSYSTNPAASPITDSDIAEYERLTTELNKNGEGDMATFYFSQD